MRELNNRVIFQKKRKKTHVKKKRERKKEKYKEIEGKEGNRKFTSLKWKSNFLEGGGGRRGWGTVRDGDIYGWTGVLFLISFLFCKNRLPL